jgi:hypothetical protein
MDNLRIFFDYLSQKHHLAIVVWVLLGYILSKIFEVFLHEKLLESGFLRGNKDKIVFFEISLVGIVLLFLASVSKFLFNANFMWFVISITAIIGGLLGMSPLSFTKKKE